VPRNAVARLLLLVAVAFCSVAVLGAGAAQREAADDGYRNARLADGMLVAMLDQQAALRAFAQTRSEEFVEGYEDGERRFERALALAQRHAAERPAELQALTAVTRAARRWQEASEEAMSGDLAMGRAAAAGERRRDALLEDFRLAHAGLAEVLADERAAAQRAATRTSLQLSLGVGGALALLGLLLSERHRREVRRREAHARLSETLQAARSEDEAHRLLKRHIELAVPAGVATVLRRNNSANRLEATTAVEDGSSFAARADSAAPESCLAIRLGGMHASDDPRAELLACELCGKEARTACVPTLVGGEVIGAVNVVGGSRLRPADKRMLRESVGQAAPVLANLRNLAIAEQRASTDALTGLPNARAARETIMRLVAHAARTSEDLTVVLFDLDHFKQINDTYGHAKGDEVLAAVGDRAASVLRTSDIAARLGGEEFLLVLPATPQGGGAEVAEKVRTELASIRVPGVDRTITASFGVSTFPHEGLEPDALLRTADRALYRAKSEGRDRVCVASKAAASPLLTN
jgi:diguanylate cyclase (GGDEF)-like protein